MCGWVRRGKDRWLLVSHSIMKWGLSREEAQVLKSLRTPEGTLWKEAPSSKEPSVQLVGVKGMGMVNGWDRKCGVSLKVHVREQEAWVLLLWFSVNQSLPHNNPAGRIPLTGRGCTQRPAGTFVENKQISSLIPG